MNHPQVQLRATEALIPYIRNARTHSDAQVAQIAASIREFGWTNPLLVDGANGLIAGHGRLLAARKLGLAEVPVIELAHLSPAQKRAYILADNKLAENAGWDEELLRLELADLKLADFDLGLIGFGEDDLAAQDAFTAAGGKWSTFVIWAKNTFTLGRADYQRQYEPILYGWKDGTDHFWCGARDQGDVWFVNKPAKNDLHPTMKPVELVERAVRNSSKSRDIVLDPFGGSGTTLIACEKLGRRARLIELDPKYADVIVRRWQDYTGGEATRVGGGETFAALAAAGYPRPLPGRGPGAWLHSGRRRRTGAVADEPGR